jgi:hypothetical protein
LVSLIATPVEPEARTLGAPPTDVKILPDRRRQSSANKASTLAKDLDLRPGNLLIFDNRRWLHGRGTAISSSSERWLLRSLFVYDSWRMQSGGGEGGQSELVVYA